ncbi:MAG TPA: ATP-binding protein [Burkholderiales bacterium]|nr:ATP-binding protein [Burkholderiales bacterium]
MLSHQFLLAATLPFLLTSAVMLLWLRPEIQRSVETSHERWVTAVAGHIEEKVHGAAIKLSVIARSIAPMPQSDRAAIEALLDGYLAAGSPFDAIYLANSLGRVTAIGLPPAARARREALRAVDISRQKLFADTRTSGEPVWSDAYLSVITRGNTVAHAFPLGSSVLVGEFTLDGLREVVRKAPVADGGLLILLDRGGRVIVDSADRYSGQQYNLGNLPIVRAALDSGGAANGRFVLDGVDYIGASQPAGPVGWELLVADRIDGVERPMTTFLRILALASVLGALVALAVAAYQARALAHRAAELERYALEVAHGHYDRPWHGTHIAEIQSVKLAVDEIAAQVMDRERRLREANATLEETVRRRTLELEKANADLSVANRDLEAFAYTASHDLRGPLRAVNGFATLLLEAHGHELSADARALFDRIRAAVARMDSLINDVLRLSHAIRSDVRLEPVDLSALARGIAAQFDAADPARRVEWRIQDGLRATADRELLRIALENLLGNARKYSAKVAAPVVELSASQHDGRTEYCLRDNGAGFDPAHAGLLFKPFKRLHGAHEFEGNGIGLATVQRILERHGGSIRAEGAVGRGAAFHFTL